jgi:hypothetical protein
MLHGRIAIILCAVLPGSSAGNGKLLEVRHILHAFGEQCSNYLWTVCIPPDTIFVTTVCRIVER